MGHVFDFKDAVAYEQWLQKPQTKVALALETRLMHTLLQPMRGESVLDIGCGTGASLMTFLEMDLLVTGLDPSTKTFRLMIIRLIIPVCLRPWNLSMTLKRHWRKPAG
jgi:ubiquinone/menaquinone biosynthesis C-methylase UbiE